MSDTPRTDALWLTRIKHAADYPTGDTTANITRALAQPQSMVSHARTLETELTAANANLAQARENFQYAMGELDHKLKLNDEAAKVVREAREKINALTADLAKLKARLSNSENPVWQYRNSSVFHRFVQQICAEQIELANQRIKDEADRLHTKLTAAKRARDSLTKANAELNGMLDECQRIIDVHKTHSTKETTAADVAAILYADVQKEQRPEVL